MCDDSDDDAGYGEGGTVFNSLGGEIRVNWERKYQENIKKYVLDWDNGTGNCVDENGIPS